MQAPNPPELAQLRDLHLPNTISWWPPAWGWYALFLLVSALLLGLFLWLRKKWLYNQPKREALKNLAQYKRVYDEKKDTQIACMQISELLKRVALVYFSRTEVASLQADAWIAFLNNTAKKVDFQLVKQELIEMPYHQHAMSSQIELLFKLAETWIKNRKVPCSN